MEITLPGNSTPITGNHPIVIIGPNGVGKTRLGVTITRENNADRVAALRNVEIPDIPSQRLQQASREVETALQQVLQQHWRQSFELQHLMAEILAEDRDLAVRYRDEHLADPSAIVDTTLSDTRLCKIARIWNRHFPGRQIKLDYEPIVERQMGETVANYPIAQMSEGERTALYLIARVISCKREIMVVDEPEVFFHPLLARNLWDELEAAVPSVRFIYVTHDIPFALSRKDAQFAVARSETVAELLPPTSSIPDEVIADVLGAASFSISASRLIFCEGLANSLDLPILTAWHNCHNTAVVPVESCGAVRECVDVFCQHTVTSGLLAFGYIDRDGWPDSHLEITNVKALPVSEIEGIFALEPIFKALAKFNGADEGTAQKQFDLFLEEARRAFVGVTLNKQLLLRAKLRVETELQTLLNPMKPDADLATMRGRFEQAAPENGWETYLGTVFKQEESRLTASLAGSPQDFVRDFPAKSYWITAAKHLQFVPEKMVETLCNALRLTDAQAEKEQKLKELRDSIVPVLGKFLWPRRV